MFKKITFIFVFFALLASVFGQTFTKICDLPAEISESSGIEFIHNNLFISHNDGGNSANIYFVDSLCQIVKKVNIGNMPNNDWEDISIDTDGTLYIGDFGNNNHKRKDLRIGIVSNFLSETADTLNAEFIEFTFEDQTEFPPPATEKYFDCEAMAVFNDSIYLISKNWSNPFTKYAKLYVLPKAKGSYAAKLVDSVELGAIKEIAWVTGMDIQNKEMILVGSAYAWHFGFVDVPRFDTLKSTFSIFPLSQKEAISFTEDGALISDESTGGFGSIYNLVWKKKSSSVQMTRNPIKIRFEMDEMRIIAENEIEEMTITSALGVMIFHQKNVASKEMTILRSSLSNSSGYYWVKLIDTSGQQFLQPLYLP